MPRPKMSPEEKAERQAERKREALSKLHDVKKLLEGPEPGKEVWPSTLMSIFITSRSCKVNYFHLAAHALEAMKVISPSKARDLSYAIFTSKDIVGAVLVLLRHIDYVLDKNIKLK